MQTVCPSCGAANRLPEGRDATAAKCGQCKNPLFTRQPAEVSGQALAAHRRSTRGAALLLDVWAPWCGPCRMMTPQFAAAAEQLEPDVRLLKLNSEAEPDAARDLGVAGIPALFLFRDGKIVARHAGLMKTDEIISWTRQSLAGGA